jgi:hypothetical protein
MRYLVTFGGHAYDPVTELVIRDAPRCGVDEVRVYDDAWLDAHEFRTLNTWLWDHRSPRASPGRGCGWYAFKPLVLLDALDHAALGDIIMLVDADTRPIADLSPIFEIASRDGAMFFAVSAQPNHRWCTRDATIVMGLDPHALRRKRCVARPDLLTPDVQAGVARFMAIQKGRWKPRQLLMEWLTYAINPMATTFEPSILGVDHPEFVEHRTEQAILTLLCHKYGYTLHREACEAGNGYAQPGNYGQLFTQVVVSDPLRHPHPKGAGSRFRNVPMPCDPEPTPEPPSKVRWLDLPSGRFAVPARPLEVSRHVETCSRNVLYGEYAYPRDAAEPVRTILDIGCNVGAFIVWAKQWWPDVTRIDAYDPNLDAIQLARDNAGAAPVFLHHEAVTVDPSPLLCPSDTIGQADNWGGWHTHGVTQGLRVPGLHPRDLPAADVLKCDNEGAGHEVFEHYPHWGGVRVALYESHHERERDVMRACCEKAGLVRVKGHDDGRYQDVCVWVRP